MNQNDLDARIGTAAQDARASVERLSDDVMARRLPGTEVLPRPRRVATAGVVSVVAVAVLMATAVLVFTGTASDDRTNVAAGPSTAPGVPTSRPEEAPPDPAVSTVVIAEGILEGGQRWILHIGGPSDGLCLGVELGEGVTSDACSSRPIDDAPPGDDAYRPVVHRDTQVPLLVFGRMPVGVGEVEAVLEDGRRVGRSPVLPGEYGPFYMVEAPAHTTPVAVVGTKRDGTSVRYEVQQ